MTDKRVSLYQRLPEIYRIRDLEQAPVGPLRNYLGLVEDVFSEIYKNIESLYHDLFIETCAEWVIPYIGDLLGVSHLQGDPWTLRAELADAIALRRRKGTLGAIERLTYDLTQWGVHCVELRRNLLWNQHLNHQRPNQAGMIPLRDPARLSLLHTPFDQFAYTADLKPPVEGNIHYNIPNLAIFLWRLEAYRIAASRPVFRGLRENVSADDDEARFIACFDVHPLGEPIRLFNKKGLYDPNQDPPVLTQVDETPNPIPRARLTTGSPAGNPSAYAAVDRYSDDIPNLIEALKITEVGLQFHLPVSIFSDQPWVIRGENLCAWESGLRLPLKIHDIAIDPNIGRFALGLTQEERDALDGRADRVFVTYTYGSPGAVGAHPVSRPAVPQSIGDEAIELIAVRFEDGAAGLTIALRQALQANRPIIINIPFSLTYALDLADLADLVEVVNEDGGLNLLLKKTLWIRAADYQRPVIELLQPLRFRPVDAAEAQNINVRLEGLYLTRGDAFPVDEPLIARAALNSLEIVGCTLDPGGHLRLDGARAPVLPSFHLRALPSSDDDTAPKQIPEIKLEHSIAGPLRIDPGYLLFLTNAIIDAGSPVNADPAAAAFAIAGATGNGEDNWGPPTQVDGITVFGRTRVASLCGQGGIWVHTLEVQDNQKGCIKFSYFSGGANRLPPHHACVRGTEAKLRFTSEIFGQPAYGQLVRNADFSILERGPKDDAMGAFGFLWEAHKWRNLQIRFREFMPVGIRPLLIPVT